MLSRTSLASWRRDPREQPPPGGVVPADLDEELDQLARREPEPVLVGRAQLAVAVPVVGEGGLPPGRGAVQVVDVAARQERGAGTAQQVAPVTLELAAHERVQQQLGEVVGGGVLAALRERADVAGEHVDAPGPALVVLRVQQGRGLRVVVLTPGGRQRCGLRAVAGAGRRLLLVQVDVLLLPGDERLHAVERAPAVERVALRRP